MADAPAWDIAPSIAPDRRAKLLTAQPFEGILARILAGANLDKAESEWEPARFGDIVGAELPPGIALAVEPDGRVVGGFRVQGPFRMFVVSDDLDALDYFFNGRSGYRGAYALSEEAGNEANRIAVAAIRPFAMRTLPAVSAPKGTNADGVFEELTEAAVRHFIMHTFSGIRQHLIGGANNPKAIVNNTRENPRTNANTSGAGSVTPCR